VDGGLEAFLFDEAASPLPFWRWLSRSSAPMFTPPLAGASGAVSAESASSSIGGNWSPPGSSSGAFDPDEPGPDFIGRATPNCGRCPLPTPLRLPNAFMPNRSRFRGRNGMVNKTQTFRKD
jgi:hypothetical protein